jgi:predicted alpha/beta hydrolase family esterase
MSDLSSKIKVIFLHGNGGSTPQDNWFPWVQKELEKCGIVVIAEQFPDADLARASYWIPFLKNKLWADNNSILVGHSSGAVAALRFAQKNNLLGTVLVGSYYTDLGIENEKTSGYFDNPWKWEKIKKHQEWIVQFASSDDPWIPIAEPRFISKQLGTEYYEFSNQGHFGGDYYKEKFPELVAAIKTKLGID